MFEAHIPGAAILALNLGYEGRAEHEVIVEPRLLPPLGRAAIVSPVCHVDGDEQAN